MCITAAVSVCALGLFILAAAHLTVSHGAVPVPLLPNNAGGRSYLDGALLGLLLQLGDLKACSRRLLSRQTPLLLGVAVNILQTWSE